MTLIMTDFSYQCLIMVSICVVFSKSDNLVASHAYVDPCIGTGSIQS